MGEYDNIPDFRNLNTKFGYNLNNLNTAYTYFKNMGLNNYQIASLLANGIAESGFNPRAKNPKTSAKGIFQWLDGRYKYSSNDLTDDQLLREQLDYVKDTLNNTTDRMSWHHGGSGSGYNRAVDAYNAFSNANNLRDAVHSFTYGYNRPDNVVLRERQRFDLAQEIYNRFNNNDVSNTSQQPFSLSTVPEFLSKKYSTKPLFKKGGKAFVDGVSVLDSNPEAYKYVKRKVKKKQDGGELGKGRILDSPYDDPSLMGITKSKLNLSKEIKGNTVKYTHIPLRIGNMWRFLTRTARFIGPVGEVFQNLFPTKEEEWLEKQRAYYDKVNKEKMPLIKKEMLKRGGLIPKAEEGTQLNFLQKANNFLNSDIGEKLIGIASKGISAVGNSIKQTNIANEFDKETDAQVKAMKNKAYNSAYSIGLQLAPQYLKDHDDVHYSDIDYRFFADMYAQGNLNIDQIEQYKLNREKQKLEQFSQGNYGQILQDGLGVLGQILGTPKKEDQTTNQQPTTAKPQTSSNDIKLDTRFTNPTWSAITSLTSGESEQNYFNRTKPQWRI